MKEMILTTDAKQFLDALHRTFNERRLNLLKERIKIQNQLNAGWNPDFPKETSSIRTDPQWKVRSAPHDLRRRFVEITGPVEKKMMINALNSGADVFMADFEDALSPTWSNVLDGQLNLQAAVNKTLKFISPEGKEYLLQEKQATLMVRPRGLHLDECHYQIDKDPISASFFDFGLYLFHCGKLLLKKGTGPYFYLPKLENREEARLWNDVFSFSENALGLPKGSICATILIETILASFQMEEILYELKDYAVGLNAGRWDYLFSIIKKFQERNELSFPDRRHLTMQVPFMRAYTTALVQACHKRGAFAMGGMSAFVPSRKNEEVNTRALKEVKEDKLREVRDGFDGTWVAHPDLVACAREVFEKHLLPNQDQKTVLRLETKIFAQDLLNFKTVSSGVSLEGLKQNIKVALQYIDSWLKGQGAVALNNLMEDAATAEIARSQLWQWVHHPTHLVEDPKADVPKLIRELMEQIHDELKFNTPFVLLKKLVFDKKFIDFLTTEAYPYLQNENKS